MRRSLSSLLTSGNNFYRFSVRNVNKLSLNHFSVVSNSGNPIVVDYLVKNLGFLKSQADSVSKRFPSAKDAGRPESVVRFFQQQGFSDVHIKKAVQVTPQILFADVGRILKPKLQLLKELGLSGEKLGCFVSTNSSLLTFSLNNRLRPSISILKETLVNDVDNKSLIRVINGCKWIVTRDPKKMLAPNISLLQRYGIVGSQLSMLLKRRPVLFVNNPESCLGELIKRAEEFGFSSKSRMFVHAIHTLSSTSPETIRKKFDVFQIFGFTEEECLSMFRRAPPLLRASSDKLSSAMDFFMNVVGIERSSLVALPTLLMHSLDKRVIPRYRVLEVLKFKKLLKKSPSFPNVVLLSEEEFLEKYISRFIKDAEELLIAYKDDGLDFENEEAGAEGQEP